MVDSTNPRIMADNIKMLAAGGGSGGTTVVANPEGAATGELEKIGIGEGIYSIPKSPDLSTNEFDTGIKWVDDRVIYGRVYTGLNISCPLTTEAYDTGEAIGDADIIIAAFGIDSGDQSIAISILKISATETLGIASAYPNRTFKSIIIYYVKPAS